MPPFASTESSFTIEDANRLLSDMYPAHSQTVAYVFDEIAYFGLILRKEIRALREFEWFDYYSDAVTTLVLYAPIFHDDSISEGDLRAATTLISVATMIHGASALDFFRLNMDGILRSSDSPFTLSSSGAARVASFGKAIFFFWLSIDQLLCREDTTLFTKAAMNVTLEKFKEECMMTGTWMRELFLHKLDSEYSIRLSENSIMVTRKTYLPELDADDTTVNEIRFSHFNHKRLHELMASLGSLEV